VRDEPVCCNCGAGHSAAFKGCVKYKEATKIQNIKITQKLSYAEAVSQAKTSVNKPTQEKTFDDLTKKEKAKIYE
jgi:hypothetical protein